MVAFWGGDCTYGFRGITDIWHFGFVSVGGHVVYRWFVWGASAEPVEILDRSVY